MAKRDNNNRKGHSERYAAERAGGQAKNKTAAELKLRIGGMTCVNCQNRIERKLERTAGIAWARVSYADGRAVIGYDPAGATPRDIEDAICSAGYSVLHAKTGKGGVRLANGLDTGRVAGILIIVVAVFFILRNFGFTTSVAGIPLAEDGMSYGLLFLIGLFTSVHCVAMCGGINISQCIPGGAVASGASLGGGRASGDSAGHAGRRSLVTFLPSLKYNLARVCSYTAVGAVVGGIGSVFSLSGDAKGVIQLIAGVFMVVMGLSMFGVIPGISRIVPHMPRIFGDRIEAAKSGGNGPVVIGLLNGLMPCGPLQAMQIYALSTGSPAQGAVSMLIFSLGTVPLMFGLGALSSLLGGHFTSRAMIVGAALVIFLGLFMFTQGLTLSGVNLGNPGPGGGQSPYIAQGTDGDGTGGGAGGDGTTESGSGATADGADSDGGSGATTDAEGNSYEEKDGVQTVHSTLGTRGYPHITVKAGTPVNWIIDAPESNINGCNGTIYIPEWNIEHSFEPGENVIEFTPDKAGDFMYSCWMGMITSSITVEA